MGRRKKNFNIQGIQEERQFKEMDKDFMENEERSQYVARVNSLPTVERHLLLLYVYYGNYTTIAKRYNCSPTWVSKKIKEIIQKIK